MDDLRAGMDGLDLRAALASGMALCIAGLTRTAEGVNEGRTKLFDHCPFEMCMSGRPAGSERIYLHGRWRCAVGEGGKGTEIGMVKI